jgi:regulator-associated protein of mTOR
LEIVFVSRSPPEQLPIVLQVLLSQAHRLRALDLLGRFLDLGPWAVNLALSVGIFPYVLKLLQSSARELRPLLVFIWAKILAVDASCQQDLVRDQSHKYFLTVLQDSQMQLQHKTWAVFVLASVVNNYRAGQDEAVAGNLISICLNELPAGPVQEQEEEDKHCSVLKQWLAICLGRLWDKHEDARWRAARCNAPESLEVLLGDRCPEVRAAAVYALGTFLNSCSERTEHANSLDQTIATKLLNRMVEDGSPLVRRELVVALQWVVNSFIGNFAAVLRAVADEEDGPGSVQPAVASPGPGRAGGRGGTMPRYAPRSTCNVPHAPYTTHHAPCTMHHAPRTTHHAPRTKEVALEIHRAYLHQI